MSDYLDFKMPVQTLQTSAELLDYLLQLSTSQFTGSLLLKADAYLSWKIHLVKGRLFWLNGGKNERERWNRHLELCLSHLELNKWKYISCPTSAEKAFETFLQLQENKMLVSQQLSHLITRILLEGIFDVIQYRETARISLKVQCETDKLSSSPLLPFTTYQICQKAMLSWRGWQNAGLAPISPNLFPTLREAKLLQEEACPWIYQLVEEEIDGTRTLRQIAHKSHQDVLSLTKSLLPLVKSGGLSLTSTPKLKRVKLPDPELMVGGEARAQRVLNPPLIALVDDSPMFCQTVEKILVSSGCRFLAVHDPLRAASTLLRNKPNLIFLDLMMPNYNGYELCVQLRKLSAFKKVPIVFFTSQDGIVNRGKAALAGATGFLSKLVTPQKVLEVLDKHLNESALVQPQTDTNKTLASCWLRARTKRVSSSNLLSNVLDKSLLNTGSKYH